MIMDLPQGKTKGMPFIMANLKIQQIGEHTVVDFLAASIIDAPQINEIREAMKHMVLEEDRRKIILNFEQVRFISSQFIGVLLETNANLLKLPHSRLILCGVGKELMQLLKITKLDRVLKIKDSEKDAMSDI